MISTDYIGAIAAGVALAVPYVFIASRPRNYTRPFSAGLILAAVVYVVFAAVGGDLRQLASELGGVVLFGLLAVLGARYSPTLLAFGWAAHVFWDLLLHSPGHQTNVPWWYPPVCVGFDLLVAGAILGRSSRPAELPKV